MHPSRTILRALAAFLLISLSASAATVKVKGGAVHEGKLLGQLVLKGGEREATSEADPSKTIYYATYTVLNGADVTAIDEKGVHSSKTVGVFEVTQEGEALDDQDIVRAGLKMAPGAAFGATKRAGTVARGNRAHSSPSADAVIGDFRDPELRNVIEIETAKGVVKVPVAELVAVNAN